MAKASEQKKQAAETLFFHSNFTQNEIADIVGVSVKSISQWKSEGKWEEKKLKRNSNEDVAADLVWRQLLNNLNVYDRRLNEATEAGEEFLLDAKACDALLKLHGLIKSKVTGWETYIIIVREVLEFIRIKNPELAKMLTELFAEFLRTKQADLK